MGAKVVKEYEEKAMQVFGEAFYAKQNEEKRRGDPGLGDGGERYAGQVHRPSAQEGAQLQADAQRRVLILAIKRRMSDHFKIMVNDRNIEVNDCKIVVNMPTFRRKISVECFWC